MYSAYKMPGRLGDKNVSVVADPRIRADLLAALEASKMTANTDAPSMDREDFPAVEAILKQFGEQMDMLYENLPNDLPEDAFTPEVEESEISIDGPDGNKIKLYIRRPKTTESKPLPGVVYLHGGAMTLLSTTAKPHLRWIKSIAQEGVVVITVDFRNAWTAQGIHNKFPAGLNDCAAGVKYIAAHGSELGISSFILQGESGGANLAIATAIKANREGWISAIAGVYGLVPYISGPEGFGWSEEKRLRELPSLDENNGYLLHTNFMTVGGYYYHPVDEDLMNPLAWPYHATLEDLKGLPPFVISVNELDPLRDEGKSFLQKLVKAGVRASGDCNLGILHASQVIFRKAVPEMYRKTVRQIADFAKILERERGSDGLKL